VFAEVCLKVCGNRAVMREQLRPKQPGHQAQGYFLAGIPVDSMATWVTFQKASHLREESGRKIGPASGKKGGATGHDISMRENELLPN